MTDIANLLAGILGKVSRPADFYAGGMADVFTPRLEVEGVGTIALPLLAAQAAQLVAVAERAPYGKGEDTLIDISVRRTWQISPAKVKISGKHWEKDFGEILQRAMEGLGVTGKVEAGLYKLLIYDKGSFFISHRDTEKAPGMFATLVVTLPSQSEGGALVVRHDGREVRLEMQTAEPSQVAFAAFYADCVHEVLPVTVGCRVALVYNLVRKGKGARLQPPNYGAEASRVAGLLKNWAQALEKTDNSEPEKLIYPLEHAYTPAELAFESLKGADTAAARLLIAAAAQAGCDIHLALLTVEESGSAEFTGYYGRGWGQGGRDDEDEDEDEDDDDFEVGEIFQHNESLSDWRRPDGAPVEFGALPIIDGELSPPDFLEKMTPDEEHFREATGNEGASFERTYRRAALVLWPAKRMLAVLNQAGVTATLPYLEGLLSEWEAGGKAPGSPALASARELAGHMTRDWQPESVWHRRASFEPGLTARMLNALTRLEDTGRIEALLEEMTRFHWHAKADNAAILNALALFSYKKASVLLKNLVSSQAAASMPACADLLLRTVRTLAGTDVDWAAPALTELIAALPGGSAGGKPEVYQTFHKAPMDPDFVADLMQAAETIGGEQAMRVANHILALPKSFDFDTLLVPAMKVLDGRKPQETGSAAAQLRAACIGHVRARATANLEPPRDWRRPDKVNCKCEHCTALSRFLDDPANQTWRLKALQSIRYHVQGTIQSSKCDLDFVMERKGSPHSLVCVKNQASYERRVTQRNTDLSDLRWLERNA